MVIIQTIITTIAAIIMQTRTLIELIAATQEGAQLVDIRVEDSRQQIHPLVQDQAVRDQAVRDQAEQDLVEMEHTAMQIRMLTIEIVQHDMTERVLR